MKSILGSVVALCLAHFGAPAMAAEATGEFWEVTSKMEMPGMPSGMAGMMGGGQAQQVCVLKGQESKPVKSRGEDNCTMTDFKQSGNTINFNMKCTGKDPMTGSGEFTHTPNSFSQKVKMRSGGEDMMIVSIGKRIGGACKGDEQINEALGGAAKSVAQNCQSSLDQNKYGAFLKATEKLGGDRKANCAGMPTAESRKNCEAANDMGCTKLRPQMCTRVGADLKSIDKFDKIPSEGLTLAAECGVDTDKIVQQHCTTMLDQKDWRFVAAHCQKDSRVAALKTQHCIGRDYTSVDAKQRDMCSTIGGLSRGKAGSGDAETSQSSAKAAAPKEPAKPNALEEMKKEGANLLKNIFK